MINQNIIQRGTASLGVMTSSYSLDRQYDGLDMHPANVGYSFSGTQAILFLTTQTMNKSTSQIGGCSENGLGKIQKLALYCCFWRNPTKRGYRKKW